MKTHELTLPEIGLLAGTRAIGWTLAAIGALTTIPLALEILGDE